MDDRNDGIRQTYSIREASRLLGIGLKQTYQAARRGDIPTITLGKRQRVPKLAFDRLLAEGRPHEETEDRGAARERP